MIRSGSVENTYPSGHGGGGGGSGVAGADGAGVGLPVAADGGDEVGPGDVGGGGTKRVLGAGAGEERVLGAGAGDVGEEIVWAVGGGEGSGSGGFGGEEMVLRVVAGVESGDHIGWVSGSGRRTSKLSDCSEIGEAVGVRLGGGGDRAGGGVRRRGRTQ
jgi:hypothetical protein